MGPPAAPSVPSCEVLRGQRVDTPVLSLYGKVTNWDTTIVVLLCVN